MTELGHKLPFTLSLNDSAVLLGSLVHDLEKMGFERQDLHQQALNALADRTVKVKKKDMSPAELNDYRIRQAKGKYVSCVAIGRVEKKLLQIFYNGQTMCVENSEMTDGMVWGLTVRDSNNHQVSGILEHGRRYGFHISPLQGDYFDNNEICRDIGQAFRLELETIIPDHNHKVNHRVADLILQSNPARSPARLDALIRKLDEFDVTGEPVIPHLRLPVFG